MELPLKEQFTANVAAFKETLSSPSRHSFIASGVTLQGTVFSIAIVFSIAFQRNRIVLHARQPRKEKYSCIRDTLS
jgi:hypothetical protein